MDVRIAKLLRDTRNAVVVEATAAGKRGDLGSKVAWEVKRAFLERLIQEFKNATGDGEGQAVFVSYSVNSGAKIFTYVREAMKRANLEVVTGFQEHAGDNDNILTRVRSQLSRSDVYLGILTKEVEVRTPDKQIRWAPSVWTMEEKGMALALQKPFVLMVEEGIHEDFWRKTTPGSVHQIFNDHNFTEVAETVLRAIGDRLEQKRLRLQGGIVDD